MNTLRLISAATVLSLTLAVSAFAGHVETPGAPCPPRGCGDASSTTTTDDVTTYIILTITSLIYR